MNVLTQKVTDQAMNRKEKADQLDNPRAELNRQTKTENPENQRHKKTEFRQEITLNRLADKTLMAKNLTNFKDGVKNTSIGSKLIPFNSIRHFTTKMPNVRFIESVIPEKNNLNQTENTNESMVGPQTLVNKNNNAKYVKESDYLSLLDNLLTTILLDFSRKLSSAVGLNKKQKMDMSAILMQNTLPNFSPNQDTSCMSSSSNNLLLKFPQLTSKQVGLFNSISKIFEETIEMIEKIPEQEYINIKNENKELKKKILELDKNSTASYNSRDADIEQMPTSKSNNWFGDLFKSNKKIKKLSGVTTQEELTIVKTGSHLRDLDPRFLEIFSRSQSTGFRQKEVLDYMRKGVQGRMKLIETPFGSRVHFYADYTASGQDVECIEDIMVCIKENYANVHTTVSHDGRLMNTLFREAEEIILKACKADSKSHSLIPVGSGATGALEFIQKIIGTYIAPMTFESISSVQSLDRIKSELRCQGKLILVIVSIYEHHSNCLTWKNQLCDLKILGLNTEGYLDLIELDAVLALWSKSYRKIVCSFSAGSNVTGIKTDIKRVTRTVKKYNALLFFDYAAIAPYVKISLKNEIDGVFFSPHKFLGGTGTSGIAIIKNRVYNMNVNPTHGGGGTVDFVNAHYSDYSKNIMEREMSGTPGILQLIKTGLVFQFKKMIFPLIEEREQVILKSFFKRFGNNPNISIYGPHEPAVRVNIVSFNINHHGPKGTRVLHHAYVVRILSDLFGIQGRSGCSCASPYGHELLNMKLDASDRLRSFIIGNNDNPIFFPGFKPGWARINLHYSFTDNDLEYVFKAIDFIIKHGHLFLKQYLFDPKTGIWDHIKESFESQVINFGSKFLMTEKIYAKDEQARYKLLDDHIQTAYAIVNTLDHNFTIDSLSELGDLGFFYIAKGNFLHLNDFQNKSRSVKKKAV